MRHFRIFRPSFGLMLRMLAGVAVCAVSSSCTDDTFDKHGHQGASGMLAFDVAAPGSWADGSAATRVADKDISIRKLTQSGGGKPLYLVTEIAEAAVDTAASNAITRGTTTTGETFKNHSFGLSATCYTGDWPGEEETNKWTTNFAHNIKVSYTESDSKWKSEKSLYWVGSENIKFFAYSPYSAAAPASSEEGAADADDATPSVIHSAADATGIPTLTYTVPTDVTKQIDLMYATADCGGNGTGDVRNGAVQLNFKHALTAVTIKTGEKMLAGKVTQIKISGVHGSGSYPIGATSWTITDETAGRTFSIDNETALDGNKDKNEIMTKPGTILNGDDKGYTFMMIPQELTDDAKLTISFTDKLTNTERTLTAKLKEFTKNGIWEIGKQYTYSINSTGIVITPVIELKVNRDNTLYPNGGYKGTWSAGNPHPNSPSLYIEMTDEEKQAYLPVSGVLNDVSIAAYMKVAQANAESAAAKEQIRKLDFTIEWSIDGGTTWNSSKESPELGWKPATGSQSRADDTDPTQPVSGSIILPAQSQFTYMRNFLYGKGTTIEGQTPGKTITDAGNGSKDAPYDLVDRNVVAQESANCYIVNDHGYYKFPAYYGNTYNKESDTSSYKYKGDINAISDKTRNFVLGEFVKHDNTPITGGEISGIEDAILLWQDSPDLVTEVKYDNGWVSFRVPEESINQGNAVIAVRGSEGILWNWHIWVTHREWDESSCHTMSDDNLNQYDKPFIIAPCNLGYCEPHVEDVERNILIRFVANGEQVGDNEIALTVSGASQPGKDEKKGIITFTQPEIAASAAGDNTYYQWGRKDPMLPGIHNDDTYNTDKELDMVNKMFYSTEQYRFTSSESARSIGESIQFPYQFFMHQRPPSDNVTEQNKIDNYKRRHWHDGRNASYGNRTIMNYWNTQLTTSGYANFIYGKEVQYYKQSPNNLYVIKTIYDPSPAGFKIPPIKAFADFFDMVNLKEVTDATKPSGKKTVSAGPPNTVETTEFKGWTVTVESQPFYFPATGVRDMGVKEQEVGYGTFPGFSSITYIATSGFHGEYTGDNNANSSCLILSIDRRDGDFKNCTKPIEGTNNAYGFTVRPIRDGQKK